MGLIPEKSTDERWKFAYELAISLLPSAVKLMGLPILEEPVIEILKAFGGESVEELFREKTPLEKTAVLIGNTLKELLENDAYNHLKRFFEQEKFDFSQVDLTKGTTPLADCFTERIIEKYSIPDGIQQDSMRSNMIIFSKSLLEQIKEKIEKNTELHTFWTIKDNNEKLTYLHDAYKADEKPINHNADYRKKWNERCCLHKNESQPLVTLETIYVMPEVQVGAERLKVGDCVKDFLKNDTQHILLLLGHGGYGKTSFVARMAAKTNEYTDRPLHIFRLREFADTDANELYKRIAEMARVEENAVLVFDGLDELCMVGGGNEKQRSLLLMAEIAKFWRDCSTLKIIVTSRPEYIHASMVADALKKATPVGLKQPVLRSYAYAVFSNDQRKELVDKLERADSSLKNSVGCQHVRAYSGEKDDPIYGSPFLLYLICAGRGITEECFSNRWLLFRTVFHDININPAYRGTTPTQREEFARNAENAEKLYRITSRLAYEIYKTGYEKQYFQKEEVLNVIRALYPDETSKLISALGDCYALCAYFKQTENGAVEFAHNHVRDFFLCEYILQELDERYAERGKGKSAEECGKKVADWLSDNFKYADVEEETGNFLQLAAKQKKTACPNVEQYFKPDELEHVFNVFCKNGGLHEYHAEQMNIKPKQASTFVVRNTTLFFKHLFFYKSIPSTIKWFSDSSLCYGARGVVEAMGWLENAHLENIILDNANLMTLNFKHSSLYHAHLEEANLRNANLFGTNLSSAYLKFAILKGACLSSADLSNADLRGANLRRANLISANLRGAKLEGAILRDANLIGANLRGAWYNDDTDFTNVTPHDFDPEKAGMKKC